MAQPLPSHLGVETHQFHSGLLVVQHRSLDSSNPESVFRFKLRRSPEESIAGSVVFLPCAPFPGHHGKCSHASTHPENCSYLSFSSVFSLNTSFPPLKFIPAANSSCFFTQRDIMSIVWAWCPWYSGMCSPHGSGAPFPSSRWARYMPGVVVRWSLWTQSPSLLLWGGRNYNSQGRPAPAGGSGAVDINMAVVSQTKTVSLM